MGEHMSLDAKAVDQYYGQTDVGARVLGALQEAGKDVAHLTIHALALPFDDGSFDAVWTQNVLMNIADKRTLCGQMFRVLRPGGRLLLQTVLAGPVPGMYYPVPWARDASLSFLVPPAQLQAWLND